MITPSFLREFGEYSNMCRQAIQAFKLRSNGKKVMMNPVGAWVPFADGMIANMKTGEVRKRVSNDMFTDFVPFKLMPKDVAKPRGEAIMAHYCATPCEEDEMYAVHDGVTYFRSRSREKRLLRMCSVNMTPETYSLKITQNFLGDRHCGKSTFFEHLAFALGFRFAWIPEAMICKEPNQKMTMDKNAHSAGLYALKGIYGAFNDEATADAILLSKAVKYHQGSPVITARAPHAKKPESFPNTATINNIGNSLQKTDVDGLTPADLGVDSFEFLHITKPGKKDSQKAVDEMFCEEAMNEWFSMLFWDAHEFYSHGMELIKEDTSSLQRKYLNDPLSIFLTKCVKFTDEYDDRVVTNELWPAFELMVSESKPRMKHTYNWLTFANTLNKAFVGKHSKEGKAVKLTVQGFGKVNVRVGVKWIPSGFLAKSNAEVIIRDEDGHAKRDQAGTALKESTYKDMPQLLAAIKGMEESSKDEYIEEREQKEAGEKLEVSETCSFGHVVKR